MGIEFNYIQDRRKELVDVFNSTMETIKSSDKLMESVQNSIEKSVIYTPDYSFVKPENKKSHYSISLSKERVIESTLKISSGQSSRIGILNFASATNVGGGVDKGASAQEESICRCTTLYPVLNSEKIMEQYYEPNRKLKNRLYRDICIYTPGVKIIKKDAPDYKPIPKNRYRTIDILSCPAPNLRKDRYNRFNDKDVREIADISITELKKILESRIQLVLDVAVENHIDILILGAFGCGAFRNPPKVVAEVFKELLFDKEYLKFFDNVLFAIYCNIYQTENYKAFSDMICKNMVKNFPSNFNLNQVSDYEINKLDFF